MLTSVMKNQHLLSIGSVSLGSKPLPEPLLIQIYEHHMVSSGNNELNPCILLAISYIPNIFTVTVIERYITQHMYLFANMCKHLCVPLE